jgi:3-phosphoshikimate 1-carboxyvinyltransferase
MPGDKSISHRSLLLNALSGGRARVTGLLRSEDVHATMAAVRALGAQVEDRETELVITAPRQLAEPTDVIDCGNSGTSMRLLCGALAGCPFYSVLTGDASLRHRPMLRVVDPLRSLGAEIEGREGGRFAPLGIRGGDLVPGRHDLRIASAQVKSALLLAGLRSGTRLREPKQSRDHSERMLAGMGAILSRDAEGWLELSADTRLEPIDVDVPGDVSSAAFFLVAASLLPGSQVTLTGVGVNPTRTGILDALGVMGADVHVEPVSARGAEPVADITVRAARLHGGRIDGELALRSLDELPILAVAASFAEGETVIADAAELRVKESDRIARVVVGLRQLGIDVDEHPDGMTIHGRGPDAVRPAADAVIDATGDHRIAMSFFVAGMAAGGGLRIEGADSISSSFPTFLTVMEGLRD